jgi:hypothetical protein
MPCYHPVEGYSRPNGQWTSKDEDNYPHATRPCGMCNGCRFKKQQEWTVRNMNEASMWDDKCFITLTYKDDQLPPNNSLDYTHWQKFIRSLKKRNNGKPIRYFAVGEYGDQRGRPHFHALLFNHKFDDLVPLQGKGITQLSKSQQLQEAWVTADQKPRGYVSVGDVNVKTASYVSGYIFKKIFKYNDPEFHSAYQSIDPTTGKYSDNGICLREPEKALMSKKPGIGYSFYKNYYSDMYRMNGDCIHDLEGRKFPIPHYYNHKFKSDFPIEYEEIKLQREEKALLYTSDDLIQHEKNFKARMALYSRTKLK